MKKGIIILITVFVVFLILIIIFLNTRSSKYFELTYKLNAGIPFRWEYEVLDESVVSLFKSYVVRNDNKGAIVGAPIFTKYVFKGLKKGKTTIIFRFINITNGRISREEKYSIIVDSKKNITLVDFKK